nr:protein SIEVE ELEMENT OCCLUSION B-like [Ipomoea batatas]
MLRLEGTQPPPPNSTVRPPITILKTSEKEGQAAAAAGKGRTPEATLAARRTQRTGKDAPPKLPATSTAAVCRSTPKIGECLCWFVRMLPLLNREEGYVSSSSPPGAHCTAAKKSGESLRVPPYPVAISSAPWLTPKDAPVAWGSQPFLPDQILQKSSLDWRGIWERLGNFWFRGNLGERVDAGEVDIGDDGEEAEDDEVEIELGGVEGVVEPAAEVVVAGAGVRLAEEIGDLGCDLKVMEEGKHRHGRDFDINVALSVAETILDSETATDREAMEGKSKELGLNYKNVPLKLRQLCLEMDTLDVTRCIVGILLFATISHFNIGRSVVTNATYCPDLLTAGHDISKERIWVLNSFYSAASLEMLWIPIVDDHVAWSNQQFENLVVKMRFLSMDDPRKQVAQRFIRFVNENFSSTFHIRKEPVIISLDKQGKIIHSNAMHMMLIWDPHNIEVNDKINAWSRDILEKIQKLKSTSSMYTSEREITLWQKEKAWNLGLLLGNIDDIIKSWENHIFLYGGNDAKWVQEFTSKVMEVSSKTHSNIQLAYVGKNEMIRASIIKENKGRILTRPYHVWWFWTRLQSSFLSRINYLNATSPGGDECNDEIARGFKNLLACESESATIKGWALKGQKVIVSGNGAKMLRVMNEYQNWTKSMAPESFGEPFKDYYKMISSCSFNSHPYCALEHPTTLKETIENEKCPECSYHMQKYITFTCKHGDI